MPSNTSSLPSGWEVVEESASDHPMPNTAKPQAAIPEGWEVVEDEPTKSSGTGALATGGVLGTLAAAVPAARMLAERVATSPMVGTAVQRLAPAAAGLNIGKLGYDIATGRNPMSAAGSALKNELLRRGAQYAYRSAAPVAQALGAEGVAGMAAPIAVPIAGGLAGLAGTAGFLGALQHDANRRVDIDYSKRTPDTDIAKVFMNMRNSEANRGRSLDERMDDPNDVMFQPDDAEIVRAAVIQGLR